MIRFSRTNERASIPAQQAPNRRAAASARADVSASASADAPARAHARAPGRNVLGSPGMRRLARVGGLVCAGAMLLAGGVGLAGGVALGAPGEPQSARDVQKLRDAESTWIRALQTSDVALLAGLVDDQFSFIGPDGQYEDRAAYLAGYQQLAEHRVQVQKLDLSDVRYRMLGDTGIVTGRVLAQVTVENQPLVEDVRFTRVYQRRGSAFRMVAGQGTRLAQ